MSTFVPPVLQYRDWGTNRDYLPDLDFLAALGEKMPFAFLAYNSLTDTVGAVLLAQQTGRGSFNAPEGAYLTHLVASCSQAAGCFVQFYDSQRQALWSDQPFYFGNGFGTAQKPLYLRKPYRVPVSGMIQSKVTNLATAAANIQLVIWGVRD